MTEYPDLTRNAADEKGLLSVRNLSVEYRTDLETVKAVSGVSFSLKKGETLGLVGETGAGKTTTALACMGLLPEATGRVTGGTVEFEGKDLLALSEPEMRKVR
ncbi:MAG: ATP-binding cassette domain-containing protein, partial [Synergistaceae bacterium]|nr:ATP-binding cassette domain-containing protein [Synergistaceae bacterium]